MSRFLSAALLCLTLSAAALADEPAPQPEAVAQAQAHPWRVGVEADPLPWAIGGYSGIVNVTTPATSHLRFGLGGFGVRALPEAMINEASRGFGVSIPWALAANVLYFFGESRGGFFTGPLGMLQQQRFTLAEAPEQTADVTKIGAGLMVGYQWFPINGVGLYLMPWVGGFGSFTVRGEPTIATRTYAEAPFAANIALHLGYEFSL